MQTCIHVSDAPRIEYQLDSCNRSNERMSPHRLIDERQTIQLAGVAVIDDHWGIIEINNGFGLKQFTNVVHVGRLFFLAFRV